jgi:DNA-binding MarR family transcriptional regulator
MIYEVEQLIKIQSETKIKVFQGEILIAYELLKNGPMSSMDLMAKSRRSVSAYNEDLKRLVQLNVITFKYCENDKRKKIYNLTKDFRDLISAKIKT